MKVYYEKDADLSLIKGKKVTIVGYGSQGHAHAQNLNDSGVKVTVGLRKDGASWEKAKKAGLKVADVDEAVKGADVVMMLMPDEHIAATYKSDVEPHIKKGAALAFAHGFNIHYGQVVPRADLDVVMVAPKAPGHRMREVFVEGRGVPALVAVHQDASGKALATALAYAKGVGATRAGVIRTTFAEEVETDWFGEQAVLCGGITELMKAGFETLVDAGYQPEVAYFECVNEMKLIVDLIYEGGFSYIRYSVSDTAEFGDYSTGKRVIDQHVRDTMQQVLKEIRDGTFAKKWISEYRNGAPNLYAQRAAERESRLEKVGRALRQMMPWLPKREVPETPAPRAPVAAGRS